MSFENPTPLNLGMIGVLAGRRYRVAGRVVMGMEEGGETYRWNEFNLVDENGKSATLVYEVAEQSGQWRLFTLYEPRHPMTVADAARTQVGHIVNLDDRPIRVTLVDESRVDFIEGEAPEGVEVGDVARYFNAGSGSGMVVVSWTGDEIEFYRGMNLPRGAVATAFGLASDGPSPLWTSGLTGSAASRWALRLVVFVFAVVIAVVAYSSCRPKRQAAELIKPKLVAAPLAIGARGVLNGVTWRISGHAVVEIAQVGVCYDRHEYDLVAEDGSRGLLVFGSKPRGNDWLLFTPFQPRIPLTPQQAAARRLGEPVALDGVRAPVTTLFRSTLGGVQSAESPDLTNGTILYGFTAQSGTNLFLVRWNESGIGFYRRQTLLAKEVTDEMKQRPVKQGN